MPGYSTPSALVAVLDQIQLGVGIRSEALAEDLQRGRGHVGRLLRAGLQVGPARSC
jgi:hypothetical protein